MWTQTAQLVLALSAVGSAREVPVARDSSDRTSMVAAESSLLQASASFEHLASIAGGHRLPSQIGTEIDPLEAALDLLCESPCMLKDETYSCRDRVQFLIKEGGSTASDALNMVSHECVGQCMCSPSDFHCDSRCMLNGETHSCRDRVQWLVREEGSMFADALDTVSHECDGQCMCSPFDFDCDSPCMFNGMTDSCRDRVQWLVREGGLLVVDALDTVSYECGGQCMCSAADFGVQEDLSTTAMMVTSPEPPHHGSTTLLSTSEASADQTTFTMTTESNSSESAQGDGDLEATPAPQQEDDVELEDAPASAQEVGGDLEQVFVPPQEGGGELEDAPAPPQEGEGYLEDGPVPPQ